MKKTIKSLVVGLIINLFFGAVAYGQTIQLGSKTVNYTITDGVITYEEIRPVKGAAWDILSMLVADDVKNAPLVDGKHTLPIVVNGKAVSFTYDPTTKLYELIDGTQVLKSGKFISVKSQLGKFIEPKL